MYIYIYIYIYNEKLQRVNNIQPNSVDYLNIFVLPKECIEAAYLYNTGIIWTIKPLRTVRLTHTQAHTHTRTQTRAPL